MTAHDGSNRAYPSLGVPEGHHDLSHHGNKEEKKKKIARINQYHIANFAYFIEKLKSIKEGDGTLLDNCMIVYGSGIADGNSHAHHDLPVLLAGRGGGDLETGRHVRYPKDTPMANLYLSILERMGAPANVSATAPARSHSLRWVPEDALLSPRTRTTRAAGPD